MGKLRAGNLHPDLQLLLTIFVLLICGTEEVLSICSLNRTSIEENCIQLPSTSSCTYAERYFSYTTEDIDLLELEFKAMNYIEENVTNQYCRNYLKAALCVTIYPPCNVSNNGSVQRLCSGECDSLLNNSSCSSDTKDVTEFISSKMPDSFVNFTLNCSDSLSFANTFLKTSICSTNSCISILENTEVPSTCVQLKFLEQNSICSDINLATDYYNYRYTSLENFTLYSETIITLEDIIRLGFTGFCGKILTYFLCNYVFVPCDLTTGAPRPICTDSCYFVLTECQSEFSLVLQFTSTIDYPIIDNCENTLANLQVGFGFPCSSSSFEDNCIDMLQEIPELTYSSIDIIRTASVTNTIQSTCQFIFPSTTITSQSNKDNNSATTAIIAASVAGTLLVLCIISICILVIMIKKCKTKKIRQGLFSVITIRRKPNKVFKGGKSDTLEMQTLTKSDVDTLKKGCNNLQELLLPENEVRFTYKIGEGEFSHVYKGVWTHQCATNGKETSEIVAIKTIKYCDSLENLKSILHESILMKKFDHPNVLPICGVCLENSLENGLPFIVLPFMANGDLKSYLTDLRRKSELLVVNQLPEGLKQSNLLDMCYQIACGMKYLAKKRFVHRDLAARNCMVDERLNIKVADFGLARDVYMTDYYRQQSTGKIPVKWMAPEALNDRISNEKTDVWSYGITCWEVFSLGRSPYATVPNHEVLKYVEKGNRPLKPIICSDKMYSLMLKCWEADVSSRLCFKDIVEELDDMIGYI